MYVWDDGRGPATLWTWSEETLEAGAALAATIRSPLMPALDGIALSEPVAAAPAAVEGPGLGPAEGAVAWPEAAQSDGAIVTGPGRLTPDSGVVLPTPVGEADGPMTLLPAPGAAGGFAWGASGDPVFNPAFWGAAGHHVDVFA